MPKGTKLQPPSESQPYRQADCHGAVLSAFDIVRLLRLPDYVWADADSKQIRAAYQGYIQCYGLVKYSRYHDLDGKRIWYGPNSNILVELVKIAGEVATAYEFVVPPDCVERIPYNALIMNIFGNCDWQIHWKSLCTADEDLPEWNPRPSEQTKWSVQSGTKMYEIVKAIYETPYETLVAAHNAAAKVIPALK